ncbi:hypothetical protein GE21DRAFT_1025092 [Neurospora crassa]|nr:hypothetical protein GE21DRAFT_1025092 [Neurospora crassa]
MSSEFLTEPSISINSYEAHHHSHFQGTLDRPRRRSPSSRPVRNPYRCLASIATAILIVPCEANCPHGGCSIEFRTSVLTCRVIITSTTLTTWGSSCRWPPWQT